MIRKCSLLQNLFVSFDALHQVRVDVAFVQMSQVVAQNVKLAPYVRVQRSYECVYVDVSEANVGITGHLVKIRELKHRRCLRVVRIPS